MASAKGFGSWTKCQCSRFDIKIDKHEVTDSLLLHQLHTLFELHVCSLPTILLIRHSSSQEGHDYNIQVNTRASFIIYRRDGVSEGDSLLFIRTHSP